MEDPQHLLKLHKICPSHGCDQAHMKKLAIEGLPLLEQVCWLGKPVFCGSQVLVFLGCSQQDLPCLDVPVETNISCTAGEGLVFGYLPRNAEFP